MRLLAAFLFAALAFSSMAAEPQIEAATQAARNEATAAGLEAGEEGRAQFVQPELREGEGDRGQGVITLGGEEMNVTTLAPGADIEKSKEDGDADLRKAHNLDHMRGRHEAWEASLGDNTAEAGAHKDAKQQLKASAEAQREMEATNELNPVFESIGQAARGEFDSGLSAQCDTTTEVGEEEVTRTVWDEFVCERTNDRSQNLCQRELVLHDVPTWIDGNERALLEVGQGVGGDLCQRTVTIEEYRPLLSLDKVADLDISAEIGGLSCERNRWAERVISPVQRERTEALPINEEIGGVSCQRWRWAETETGSVGGTKDGLLNINAEAGGQMCSRTRWPSTQTQTTPGTVSALLGVSQEESNTLSGSKWHWPTGGTNAVSNSLTADLNINTEVSGLSCSRTIWPTSITNTSGGSKIGVEINVNTETPGQAARKYIRPYSSSTGSSGTKTGILDIDGQTNGLQCTRTAWPENTSAGISGSHSGVLSINTEIGGQEARRRIAPYNTTNPEGGSKLVNLVVDNQAGGLSCERVATPSAGTGTSSGSRSASLSVISGTTKLECNKKIIASTSSSSGSGSKSATLSVNTETGGVICSRSRWVTAGAATSLGTVTTTRQYFAGSIFEPSFVDFNLSANMPAGTQSITDFWMTPSLNCHGHSSMDVPSLANGWTVSSSLWRNSEFGCSSIGTMSFSWRAWASSKSWSVNTSGTCSGSSTANCSVAWSCNQQAPTTINGISVTAEEVGAQSALYTGAPSACTSAEFLRTCSGTATTTTSVSISDALAPGTTSINNFNYVVTNPQSGVSVSLTQSPSAANSWTAVFSVSRTSWSSVPTSPQITMTWGSTITGTSGSLQVSGNCNATSSTNCPVDWSCAATAPVSTGGGTVTTAIAAEFAPLYPGASSSCAEANLNRSCSGTGISDTSVTITVPAGTTSVSNFSYTVLNPQGGVTVSLVQTPSSGNGWNAIFRVSRTDWSYEPATPQVNITWTNHFSTTTMSLVDTGNCNDAGSSNCPATWSCVSSAPFVVNGVTVTSAMASQVAPMYSGASSSCVVGRKTRVCAGTATIDTSVSIADRIPAGVSSISDFNFAVQNPQAGVTVSLLQTPSAANNWIAVLRTSRTVWNSQPNDPSVLLTWGMSVPSVGATVQESGNVAATGTANCPMAWRCDIHAPATVDGLAVTTAMANGLAPLFAGAANTCVDATLNRTCSGTANTTGTISIASSIPAGTTSISGFSWNVTNAQSGVTVSLVSAPTAANNWVATFSVARSDWTYTPSGPVISMSWVAAVPGVTMSARDDGSCSVGSTPNCTHSWSCSNAAPTTVNGISVTSALAAQVAPLYSGASSSCVVATLNRSCTGTATTSSTISIADQIPAGVTTISGFGFSVLNVQSGVTVTLMSEPTAANSWVATFSVAKTDYSSAKAAPEVRLNWNMLVPTVEATVETSGDPLTASTANCAVAWRCDVVAPNQVSGLTVTTNMAQTFAPLYSGAANTCSDATLNRTCSGTATTDTNISIAADIAAGTTAISNFQFVVKNPQSGISVSLLQAPSAANSWIARFQATRTSWSGMPSKPQLDLSWDNNIPGTATEVRDTGNCSDAGTTSCPAAWSCIANAPTTINGILVSTAMAEQHAPLYPAATSTCATAELRRICGSNGPIVATTDISIAGQLPNGTTAISGFGYLVNNVQAGVTVTLLQTPSIANNWVARFSAERTSDFGTAPSAPNVTLSWTSTVPVINWSIESSGSISDPGTADCPAQWSCAVSAPATINGIEVTSAMAQGRPSLYSGASNTCLTAELRRVCGGTPVISTSVSIAAELPANTTSISGFAYTVNNVQPGVAVALTQTPSEANNWVAVFSATRTSWGSVPNQPNVTLSWTASHSTVGLEVRDSGDCSATGSPNCPVSWTCTSTPTATINGISVTPEMVAGLPELYPGASPPDCLTATLSSSCTGTGSDTTDISIAAELPAGTITINNFNYSVLNPQPGVVVTLLTPPTSANGWVARFQVERADWSSVPAQPQVRLTWDVPTTGIVLSVRETGNCADPGSDACPTTWGCTQTAPTTINGIVVSAEMASAESPLYPAAASECTAADLKRVCTGSHTIGSQIQVGDLIPDGATEIRDFAWTVLNPQEGVDINLVSPPTLANGWVATFDVVRRVWNAVPARPEVTVTFTVDEVSIAISTRETGDCQDAGTEACPTQWSCARVAPGWVGDIFVTADMIAGEPQLYPGSSADCMTGQLSRVCNGSATTAAQVSIGDMLPAGTTEIFNFTWTQLNAELTPGTTTTLIEAPTAGNGWVALFQVARDYSAHGNTATKPNVRLQWQIYGDVEYIIGETTTGDCNPGNEGMCRDEWVCNAREEDVTRRDRLRDWWEIRDPETSWDNSCLEGRMVRICEGDGATITDVSIAHHIPAGKTIRNYRWSVSQTIEGVTVTSLQEPAEANGWVARFQTARTDWTTPPAGKPEVLLEWEVEGVTQTEIELVETGDCSLEGDAFCPSKWVCRETLDDIPNTVSTDRTVAKVLAAPWNTESLTHQVSLGAHVTVPPMHNFQASMSDAYRYNLTVVTPPSAENGWVATVQIDATYIEDTDCDAGYSRLGEPGFCRIRSNWRTVNVTFTWTEHLPSEDSAGNSSGDVLVGREPLYPGADPLCIRAEKVTDCSNINAGEVCHTLDDGDPSVPGRDVDTGIYLLNAPDSNQFHSTRTNISLASAVPSETASITELVIVSQQQPQWHSTPTVVDLPTAANNWTVTVDLYARCGTGSCEQSSVSFRFVANVSVASDGQEWCEAVPPGSNTCTQFEQAPNCELDREMCSEDGVGEDGFCYAEAPVYRCSREVTGTDIVRTDRTVCSGVPICEGSTCEIEEDTQVDKQSAAKGVVGWLIGEAMSTDYER